MGPARTGKGVGAYQFDRVFPGVGRIKKSSGTDKLKEFQRRDALLTKLFETSALEVLRAYKAGQVTIEELIEADRGNNPALPRHREADGEEKARVRQWTLSGDCGTLTVERTIPCRGPSALAITSALTLRRLR